MDNTTLQTRILTILRQIPATVTLVAVTKTVPIETIQAAAACGIHHIGENRVQEAQTKWEALQPLGLTWHLIGHLQKNKVAKALQLFDWIHSVDSLDLAKRIDSLAAEQGKKPNLLLQIKLVPDDINKSGFTLPQLEAALTELACLEHVAICGLMTMAPYDAEEALLHKIFSDLRGLSLAINDKNLKNIQMTHLSMGMSQDYPIAIQEGATFIRVGSKIFSDLVK